MGEGRPDLIAFLLGEFAASSCPLPPTPTPRKEGSEQFRVGGEGDETGHFLQQC